MEYKHVWKSGSHHKVDAQVAGDECSRVEREVGLTPKNLVDASRPEDAPLHSEFEWDDTLAAERYRETQASSIIRHLVTVEVDGKEVPETRSYVSVPAKDTTDNDSKNAYVNIYKALTEPETKDLVLRRALSELRAFERKYKNMSELAGVFSAIGQLELDLSDSAA